VARIDLPPFPNGWFAVALSEELAPGDITARTYFGEELAVLRDQAGTVAVLDAYCPHLGAHLGHGGNVGDGCVRCPFHGWEFSLDGACIGVPYGGRIPPKAEVRTWPVIEQDGVILVWHSSDGGDPTWFMPSFGNRKWTYPRAMLRTVCSHPQEILENTVDFAHFRFVHETHMVRPVTDVKLDGPTLEVVIVSDPDAASEEFRLPGSLEVAGSTFCHGPGLAAATIGSPGVGPPTLQRLYATPIDGERIHLRGLVSVQSEDDPAAAEEWADLIAPPVFENWDKDIAIWEYTRYRPRPMLNSSERAIPVFRRWYGQFYTSDSHRLAAELAPAPGHGQ
jgi:nitrite reductase/ring-hydroxylating ferredoxin subunit